MNSGRPETNAAAGSRSTPASVSSQIVGIALHDVDRRKALAQQPAEVRIELDQREPRGIDAALDQRFGDRPGAGAELDDRPGGLGIDVVRHDPRQRLARRRHRADGQRLLDPGAQETEFVAVEVLLLEVAQPPSDPAADRAALELDEAELPLDLALEDLPGRAAAWV